MLLANKKVAEFIGKRSKVKIEADPVLDERHETAVEMQVRTKNGDTYYKRIDIAAGFPPRSLTREEIIERFWNCVEYAEKPLGKGLFFMDGSAMASELISGEAAAGAHIHIYSVGGGICSSFRCLPGWPGEILILPQISVVSKRSKPQDSLEKEFFDIYADTIIRGTETTDEVADKLFTEVIDVASGKLTKREMRTGYRESITMYTTGPIL